MNRNPTQLTPHGDIQMGYDSSPQLTSCAAKIEYIGIPKGGASSDIFVVEEKIKTYDGRRV